MMWCDMNQYESLWCDMRTFCVDVCSFHFNMVNRAKGLHIEIMQKNAKNASPLTFLSRKRECILEGHFDDVIAIFVPNNVWNFLIMVIKE